jgi:hypothetical protein
MSELQFNWPLDIARSQTEQAEWLQAELAYGERERANVSSALERLQITHPLLGQEVEVWGRTLTEGLGEDGRLSNALRIPPTREATKARGTYVGFDVIDTYDPELEATVPKVVHVVRTVVYNERIAFRWIRQTSGFDYVLVEGSDINPVRPINAHSLKDLHGDKPLEALRGLVADERRAKPERVRALGELANILFAQSPAYETPLHHQRISMVNSLGLLEGRVARAYDFAVVANDQRLEEHGDVGLSSMHVLEQVRPRYLEAAPTYTRTYDKEGNAKIVLSDPLELYLRSTRSNDGSALVPLKNVTILS